MDQSEDAEIAGNVLVGIVACGVLAGDSDGQVKDEEVDALVTVVASFLEGLGWEVSADEIHTATGNIAQEISDLGVAKVLAGLSGLLTDDDQRRIGCMVAAAVVGADGEIEQSEARMYGKVASTLGFTEAEAEEIWEEVLDPDEEDDEDEDDEEDDDDDDDDDAEDDEEKKDDEK